jgi:hypothetical protein
MTRTSPDTAPTPARGLTPAPWMTETSADVTDLDGLTAIRINYDGDSHDVSHTGDVTDELNLNLTQELTITNGVVDPGLATVHLTLGLSAVDFTAEQARAMAALLTRLASELDS